MNIELKQLIDNTNIENFSTNSSEIILKIIRENLSLSEIKEVSEYIKETF